MGEFMKNTFLLIFLLMTSAVFSNQAPEANVEEKKYTETEFNSKLSDALGKKLKHLGKGQIEELSKELLDKERDLKAKEILLEKKEEQLKISTEEFKKKLHEFQERQNSLIVCLDDVEKQESERVGHMVETVSGMRPQNAADVLSVQDSEISVKILSQLPSDKVAKIFNLMNKEVSARLQKQYLTMKK
ncbi:MAG: hypothetical protein A2202_03465 [Bdellovibrionales bacterium RIFOXYA1_FULL_36_14]|nr:MAG: hypothetical protein A2202_03465 [Bdellovibrionales bacterium RIFOXYA1_FULL_36_14]